MASAIETISNLSSVKVLADHQRLQLMQDLGKACQEWGFFMVVNHGIPEALIEATTAVVDEFFDLPEAEKMEYQTKHVIRPHQIWNQL
ncbi:OLC1v1004740C1 [Oldenlandia corymbosa var. corymbosa]|uniref:OLC1v1004740C1 n=1 Tax=Oldenlandia corymbosa var. corymbosa TaxID=529605 RepID=A0AAV1DF18_OLDCO|nr:OLC1v1004740C1 [Oldenlandia corymbosa var. corymbosa]